MMDVDGEQEGSPSAETLEQRLARLELENSDLLEKNQALLEDCKAMIVENKGLRSDHEKFKRLLECPIPETALQKERGFKALHGLLWNRWEDEVLCNKVWPTKHWHIPIFSPLDCYRDLEFSGDVPMTTKAANVTRKEPHAPSGRKRKAQTAGKAPDLGSEAVQMLFEADNDDPEDLDYGINQPMGQEMSDYEFLNLHDARNANKELLQILPCKSGRLLIRKCYDEIIKLVDSMVGDESDEEDEESLGLGDSRRYRMDLPGGESTERAKYFVVTGQPGVGKSCFQTYLMVRRTLHGEPTIIKTKENLHFYLAEGGAELVLSLDSLKQEIKENKNLWYISDGRPDFFVHSADSTCWTVITISSPKEETYFDINKRNSGICIYMAPWEWGEVFGTAFYVEFMNGPEIFQIWRNFLLYGPIARTLLRDMLPAGKNKRAKLLVANFETNLKRRIEEKIRDILRQNSDAFLHATWLSEDSHTIVLTRPIPGRLTDYTRDILTPNIAFQFTNASEKIRRTGTKALLMTLGQVAEASTLRGYIWEGMVHGVMKDCAADEPRAFEFEDLFGIKYIFTCNGSIVFERLEHLKELVTLDLTTPPSLEPGVVDYYLRPAIKNFESVDSLMITKDSVLMFQITCAKSHEVKVGGLEKVFKSMPKEVQKLKWKLVFVVPGGQISKFTKQKISGTKTDVAKWNKSITQMVMTIENSLFS